MSNVVPLLNPAVRGEYAIEMLAREICKAEGLNPDCHHQNYGHPDEVRDGTLLMSDGTIRTYRLGWRRFEKAARAIADALVLKSGDI